MSEGNKSSESLKVIIFVILDIVQRAVVKYNVIMTHSISSYNYVTMT